jgi:glycosyltransferase involved in cell wall biosynthesis
MHIGINALFLIPGEVGGSETYLCETLRALMAEYPATRGTIFSNRENASYFHGLLAGKPGWKVVTLDFAAVNRYARVVREQLQLPQKAGGEHLDLLWSPGYTAPIWAPCPQLVSILDMQYKSHPEDLSPVARASMDLLVRVGVRRCRKILTISEFSRREIERFFPNAGPKIHVTHLAADERWLSPVPETAASRGDVAALVGRDTTPYLLCVANSYPHKNLHGLVKAFAIIAPRVEHRLVIVGKPRLGERMLLREIAALSDPGRVCRLHGLAPDDLRLLYQRAALFVFPSLYEGFGLPVLEAMLSGTPVLTTRMGSLPEVGGRFACYAEGERPHSMARAMLEILAWSAEYRACRNAQARRWALGFSWQRTARATMDCFRLVAAG